MVFADAPPLRSDDTRKIKPPIRVLPNGRPLSPVWSEDVSPDSKAPKQQKQPTKSQAHLSPSGKRNVFQSGPPTGPAGASLNNNDRPPLRRRPNRRRPDHPRRPINRGHITKNGLWRWNNNKWEPNGRQQYGQWVNGQWQNEQLESYNGLWRWNSVETKWEPNIIRRNGRLESKDGQRQFLGGHWQLIKQPPTYQPQAQYQPPPAYQPHPPAYQSIYHQPNRFTQQQSPVYVPQPQVTKVVSRVVYQKPKRRKSAGWDVVWFPGFDM